MHRSVGHPAPPISGSPARFERLEPRRLLTTIVTENIYHTQSQLQSELQSLADAFPTLTELFTIGQSEQGRDLFGLRISDNVGVQEDEPEVKFTGPVHGDEPVGQALLLYLADDLLHGYGTNPRYTQLINETELVFLPQLNPDGYLVNSRRNINGVDLNRDYPEGSQIDLGSIFDGDPLRDAGRQAETQAVMQFSADHSFTLSANMHSGALVAVYPYDNDGKGSNYSATPDDDLFRELALTYSEPNTPMFNSSIFPQGIVNGADWYVINGGMQDWMYRYLADFEITLEVSQTKRPSRFTLDDFYADNQESMLAYAEAAHRGVRGLVTDAGTGEHLYAEVSVVGGTYGAGRSVYTDPDVGDYHRMLLPGTYDILVEAPGYESQTFSNVLVTSGEATRLDVALAEPDTTSPTVTFADFFVDDPLPSIRFGFDEPVAASLTVNDLIVTRDDGFVVSPGDTDLLVGGSGATFALRFTQPLGNGNYTMTFAPGGITDAAGNVAADSTVSFYILAGDANRDRIVDLQDFLVLRGNFGSGSVFTEGDFNYDGSVDLDDFLILRSNFGESVPALLPISGDDDGSRSLFA